MRRPLIRRRDKGFTLIELLLYIAMFSIVIGAIMGLLFLATFQRVKNQVIADVNFQGEAVMAAMTQAIHDASGLNSPALGSSAASLSLASGSPAANPTVFDSFNDGTTTRLRLSQGTPAVPTPLTNSHVRVTSLNFSNVGLVGSAGSIKIQFTLAYINPSGRTEYDYSKIFYGSASLR